MIAYLLSLIAAFFITMIAYASGLASGRHLLWIYLLIMWTPGIIAWGFARKEDLKLPVRMKIGKPLFFCVASTTLLILTVLAFSWPFAAKQNLSF